ncbi:MAG: hypothetical protein NTY20_04770 [Candidatus Aenigmarchaeota archaeon]|nr:hypothetical protein [Candidatus Aenigmarchaeota archaeon]
MKRIDISIPPYLRALDSRWIAVSEIYEKMDKIGIPRNSLYGEGVIYDYSIIILDFEKAEEILHEIDNIRGFSAKEGNDLLDKPLDITLSAPYRPHGDVGFDDSVLFREGHGMTAFKSLQ